MLESEFELKAHKKSNTAKGCRLDSNPDQKCETGTNNGINNQDAKTTKW